mmetsp:Transcript_36080/g.107847  ORF Transcript_36080/g.107847 Transcript_36080/m.107847 type:complete len:212 (-) Transcript_36080:270-905(-)
MVGDAPHILGGLGVAVDDCSSFQHAIAVMVPNENLHRVQASSVKGRPEMIADEARLLLRGEEARLPRLQALRLVLHAHPPDGDPGTLHLLDEEDVVVRPRAPALFPEGPRVEALGRPHPGDGTPGAGQQHQRRAGDLRRTQDHRNDCDPVVVDAEARQARVIGSGLPTRPGAQAEVTGANRQPAQRVAKSRPAIKVGVQQLILPLLRQCSE